MDLHCLRNICTYFDHTGHLGARMAFTLKYKPVQHTVLTEVFSSCANSFTLYIYIYSKNYGWKRENFCCSGKFLICDRCLEGIQYWFQANVAATFCLTTA